MKDKTTDQIILKFKNKKMITLEWNSRTQCTLEANSSLEEKLNLLIHENRSINSKSLPKTETRW